MFDLFADDLPWQEPLAPGAIILRRYARDAGDALVAGINDIVAQVPFRHQLTPGGHRMSAAMSGCGACGWVSDAKGYRYETRDPLTGKPWPPIPSDWLLLASQAAEIAGFTRFNPDSCLINRYVPGSKMSLHQDKDERNLAAPIVSVSLGVPAVFLFGGLTRSAPTQKVLLEHGDVVVWGGPSRLNFHAIAPLKHNQHRLTGDLRLNMTFRQTGMANKNKNYSC